MLIIDRAPCTCLPGLRHMSADSFIRVQLIRCPEPHLVSQMIAAASRSVHRLACPVCAPRIVGDLLPAFDRMVADGLIASNGYTMEAGPRFNPEPTASNPPPAASPPAALADSVAIGFTLTSIALVMLLALCKFFA